MTDNEKMVPLTEAAEQVKVTAARLALMHLAYARTLVEMLGKEKGKALIIKSMMEYGRLVGERNRRGGQDLPFYGLHGKLEYKDREYKDSRDIKEDKDTGLDLDAFKVHGCVLSEVFKEYGEEELGRLYCFVDASKSMAANPGHKLIHTACEVCGDDHCAFQSVPTTEQERQAFDRQDLAWKEVDPLLDDGRK